MSVVNVTVAPMPLVRQRRAHHQWVSHHCQNKVLSTPPKKRRIHQTTTNQSNVYTESEEDVDAQQRQRQQCKEEVVYSRHNWHETSYSDSEKDTEHEVDTKCDVEDKQQCNTSHAPSIDPACIPTPSQHIKHTASVVKWANGEEYGSGTSTHKNEEREHKTSRYLSRDELDSVLKGVCAKENVHAFHTKEGHGKRTSVQPRIFSEREYTVKESSLRDVTTIMRRCEEYNFCILKLWASICPDDIDVSHNVHGDMLPFTKWFHSKIVNEVWKREICALFKSIALVGYAGVTYSPHEGHNNEVCPHVLDPTEYKLKWRIDQHGVRQYTMERRPSLIPSVDNTSTLFEYADVFVDSHPLPTGEITSRARACMRYAVHINQSIENYQILDHSRANVPLVMQTPGAWQVRVPPWDPYTQGAARRTEFQGLETLQQRTIDASMAQYAQAMRTQTETTYQYSADAVANAASHSRITSMRYVDPYTGAVDTITPELMWQRSVLTMPPGSELRDMHIPDTPAEFSEVMRQMKAAMCAIMGVPPELLSGTSTGKSNVSSSATSHEHLRSTVMQWRELFEQYAKHMYWRIYGEDHIYNVMAALLERGYVLDVDTIVEILKDIDVVFTFRKSKLDYQNAYIMYQQNILKGSEVKRIVVDEYGLDPDVVLNPDEVVLSQLPSLHHSNTQQQQQQQHKTMCNDRRCTPERGNSHTIMESDGKPGKSAQIGDIHMEDVGSIGFADHVRFPGPAKRIIV